jgi:hypothetical protein
MEASLGQLLQFLRRTRPVNAGDNPPGDAQILIFTGVRYERGSPPPKTHVDSKRRKRKRV